MILPPRHFIPLLVPLLLCSTPLRADWKTSVGYDRLTETFTSGVPDAVSAGVTQVEAGTTATDTTPSNNYLPNSTDTQFSDKTINNLGNGTGTSAHATKVGQYFYGNTSSLTPGTTQVDAYSASSWTGLIPYAETRRVQNHSWIGTAFEAGTDIDSAVTTYDTLIDYMANTYGTNVVVGVGNGYSTTLPYLLCQGYNQISVGLVSGSHSAGLTAYDTAGRMKPDIVGFESLTSYATPQVSSAAGLLTQKILDSYSSGLVSADLPRLTKALLIAGAAKEPLNSWSRADTTKPYDATYGAGALNIFLAYRALLAGRKTASSSSLKADTGWNTTTVRSSTNASSRTYYFDISSNSVSVPFSASLIWHRVYGQTFANLDLHLYAVASGTFTLGTEIDSSISSVDNVEHIYQAALAPGRYALQVTSSSSTSTSYALAWRTSPTVTVAATTAEADELTGSAGVFTLTRTGPTTSPLVVPITVGGTAVSGTHYTALASSVTIPAGLSTATVTVTPVSDDIAQGDRTVTVSVATDYSLSAGSTAEATVTIKDKPYDEWRFARFTSEQLADDTVSGYTADPDADGITNLLEYALDTEPLTADSPDVLPQSTVTDDHLSLTYRTLHTDITYVPQWSVDLDSWLSGTTYTTEAADGDTVTSTAVSALTDEPRQFMRLQVTRP